MAGAARPGRQNQRAGHARHECAGGYPENPLQEDCGGFPRGGGAQGGEPVRRHPSPHQGASVAGGGVAAVFGAGGDSVGRDGGALSCGGTGDSIVERADSDRAVAGVAMLSDTRVRRGHQTRARRAVPVQFVAGGFEHLHGHPCHQSGAPGKCARLRAQSAADSVPRGAAAGQSDFAGGDQDRDHREHRHGGARGPGWGGGLWGAHRLGVVLERCADHFDGSHTGGRDGLGGARHIRGAGHGVDTGRVAQTPGSVRMRTGSAGRLWGSLLFATGAAWLLGGNALADEWGSYGRDPQGTRFSPLVQITPQNVATLRSAWTFHTGDISVGSKGRTRSGFETTPLMINGRLYLTTPFNRVIALDPTTGRQLWAYDPKIDEALPYGDGLINRGLAAWRDPGPQSRHCA